MPPNVGEVRNALRAEKPAACSRCRALVEHRVDLGREGRALHRDLAVALDEHEQDVLAAQAGQQLVAGRVAEVVVGDLAGERRLAREARLHGAPLVDGEVGGARGGDRRPGDDLRAERPAAAPRRRRAPRRPGATTGGGRPRPASGAAAPGSAARQTATTSTTMAATTRSARVAADRVAQRLDADAGVAPVVDRVERPVEAREEPHVEQLHEHQQAEHRPERPRPGRGARSAAGSSARATTTRPSSGSRANALQRSVVGLVAARPGRATPSARRGS